VTGELEMLEAEARYADDRLRLYRARAYGSRLTSPARLRDLEGRAELAQRRLARARASAPANRQPSD
jgi:hypothetical protein